MTTTTKPTARTDVLSPLPALPPEIAAWRWEQSGGAVGLHAPDGWRTNTYQKPDRAIAEAMRRVQSTPKTEGARRVEYVKLDQLRTDGGTQARAGLDEATVAEYAETYDDLARQQNGLDQMPPIVVYYDGSVYWLADGFHRVAAYTRFVDGRSASGSPRALRAEIRQGTRRDAVLHACGANAAHGLKRTNADKRRAIETMLRDEEWRQWSDSEIGRRCNVSHPTVAAARKELYPENLQDSRTVERNGTTYQMTPAARPAPNAPGGPHDAFDDARERFAALGWKLERHGVWYKLSKPDGEHFATTSDLQLQLNTLATFEAGAARRAAETTEPPTIDDIRERADRYGLLVVERSDGILLYWPGEDTSDFEGSPPDEARWLLETEIPRLAVQRAEELGWQLLEVTRAGQRLFCCRHPDGRQTAEYGIDLLAYGEALRSGGGEPAPTQVPPSEPTTPPCEDCGELPTTRQRIGGLLAHFCERCARSRIRREIHAVLYDQAEHLGAAIDYMAQRDDGRLKVLPPAGFQQTWLWCNAAELEQLCTAWEQRALAQETKHGIDWEWIARRARILAATDSETEAWEHWRSIGCALAGGKCAWATRLLTALAPLVADLRPEGIEDLSAAIAELNECAEGTEGEHWTRVGWALLDVEAPESAGAVPTLASEGIGA